MSDKKGSYIRLYIGCNNRRKHIMNNYKIKLKNVIEDSKKVLGIDFSARKPAIQRKPIPLMCNIVDGYYTFHQIKYLVTIRANKTGKYKTVQAIKEHLRSFKLAGIKVAYRRIRKKGMDIELSGRGLLPANIRSRFFHVCKIEEINAVHIELKCFPSKEIIPEERGLDGYSPSAPPNNSNYTAKDFFFNTEFKEYVLGGYKLNINTWGPNLELMLKDQMIPESEILKTMQRMYSELTDVPFINHNELRPVSSVISANHTYRPSGILVKSARNRNAANQANNQALSMIRQDGYINHKELMKLYAYNPKPKAAAKMAKKFADRHSLKYEIVNGEKLWKESEAMEVNNHGRI